MKLINNNLLFALIIALFLATRLFRISDIPTSLYWDEASIGYNAYSVLKTGKDEWGELLPVHFRAFGEFKLPVYVYTTAIFTAILGMNEWSVRLPAVIFGLGSLVAVYLLARELSKQKVVAILSALMFSISPWLFIFTRTGYEATAGLMFFLSGVYLVLKKPVKGLSLLIGFGSFILSIYSYNSFRIITPLTIAILLLNFFITEKPNKKTLSGLFIGGAIFLISLFPIFKVATSDYGFSRLEAVRITNYQDFFKNYVSHLSPPFLFVDGDKNMRSQQAGFGQLYWLDLLFYILGLIFLFKEKKIAFLVPIALLLIGFIPAAITKESPHALRSIASAPFIVLIAACGVYYFSKLIGQKRLPLLVSGIYLSFFAYYFYNFITFYPVQSSQHWQYQYRALYKNEEMFEGYDQIIIDDEYAQPYIFALYYLNYNPNRFRETVEYNPPGKWGISTVSGFDKFVFRRVTIDDFTKKKALIFTSKNDTLVNEMGKDKIYNLDGSVAFYEYDSSN